MFHAGLENYLEGLCLPAQLYLALAVVGALGSMFQAPGGALVSVLFGAVWSAVVNAACQNGYTIGAWVLALAPTLILGMLAVVLVAALTAVPHHELVTKKRIG